MSSTVAELVRFVPRFIQRRLARDPSPPKEPIIETFPGVIGFADISGFTELATRLAKRGVEGAEELNQVLSGYYTALVDTVLDSGGDVIAFAGDAALIVWEAQDDGESLRQTLLRACETAEEIVRLPNERDLASGIHLAEKVTISCGDIIAAEIGGVGGFWQPIVVGEPLRELRLAADVIQKDEVILAPSAVEVAGESIRGTHREGGHLLLAKILDPAVEQAPTAMPVLPDNAADGLRCYVAPAVSARLESGRFDWLAELRHVTVIFGQFEVRMSEPDTIPALQRIMVAHQQALARFEGMVVQLIADDKGTVSLCCFGLPPLQHENDAPRAVRAAQAIQEELSRIEVGAGFGLSTGRIFCGPRGNFERRCEYAVTGDVVIRAARIMSKSDGRILCDEETRAAAARLVDFREEESLNLKGISDPVSVFSPGEARMKRATGTGRMVGRALEMDKIGKLLDDLKTNEQGGVLFLEGEPGIGKSTLIDAASELAESLEVAVLFGESNAIERSTPYFVWRNVLSGFVGISPSQSSVFQRESVVARLKNVDPEFEPLAPLLNAILPIDLPESEIVSQMDDQLRADHLTKLVVALIADFAAKRPVLLILDDGQWLDSASWELASQMARRVPRLALIMAMRPIPQPVPSSCLALSETDDFQLLHIDMLSDADLRRLAEQVLGAESVTDRLTGFLFERSQGNPFFAEELAGHLKDAGYLDMDAPPWDLRESELVRSETEVPSTIRALVTSRIDRLGFDEQMTMKAASVIGLQFAKDLLLAVHPDHPAEDRVAANLLDLLHSELAKIEAMEPDLVYMFRHATIQQVTYDQLTSAQRQPLHRAIATWHEEVMGSETAGFFPLLAYHWARGGKPEKEMHYLELAGNEALRQYANHEARRCFSDALERHREICGSVPSREERLRRANWERLLGEALFRLGDLPGARQHLENCLIELGRRLQAKPGFMPLYAFWQISKQAMHRVFLRNPKRVDESEIDPIHEIALACQRLSQLHYLQSDMALGFTRSIRGMNFAERHGLTVVLARAYSGTSLVIGMLGAFRAAEFYARRAEESARETGHLQTLAYVLMATGVYRISVAQWERNRKALDEAVAICEKLDDRRQLSECVTVQAMHACLHAEYREGYRLYSRLGDLALQTDNKLHHAWSFSGRSEATFRLGDFVRAIGLAETSLELSKGQDHFTEEVRLNGIIALSNWRIGKREEGLAMMEKTITAIHECRYATVSTLEGFGAVMEICQEMEVACPEEGRWRQVQCEVLPVIRKYSKVYPVWRPRLNAFEGVMAWRAGNEKKARRKWAAGIRLAEEFDSPLELGIVHFETARSLNPSDADRAGHLVAAAGAFERAEAKGEIDRVNQVYE